MVTKVTKCIRLDWCLKWGLSVSKIYLFVSKFRTCSINNSGIGKKTMKASFACNVQVINIGIYVTKESKIYTPV